MSTICPTFIDFCSPQNLALAFGRYRKAYGRWSPGVSMVEVSKDPVRPMLALADAIQSASYRPSPPARVQIAKADGTCRTLNVYCVRDRVVQKALLQVLQPVAESVFLPCSFGFRPNRGVAHAIEACRQWVARGFVHAVDADIKNCFENIDAGKAVEALCALVRDERLRNFVRVTCAPKPKGGSGLSPGGVLSPLLCNVFLNEFDRETCAAGAPLVRYADDFVIFAFTESLARRALFRAADWMARHGLSLHPSKTRLLGPSAVCRFLGADLPRPVPLLTYKESYVAV